MSINNKAVAIVTNIPLPGKGLYSIPANNIDNIYNWNVDNTNLSFKELLDSKFYIVSDVTYYFYFSSGKGGYCKPFSGQTKTVIWLNSLSLNGLIQKSINILDGSNIVSKSIGSEPTSKNTDTVWIYDDINYSCDSFCPAHDCTNELADSQTRAGYNNMKVVIPSNQQITNMILQIWANSTGFSDVTLNVNITCTYRTCTSEDLNQNSSCMQYCTPPIPNKIPSECFDIMKQYCFSQSNNKYNFITDPNCYSYFTRYYEENPTDIPLKDDDMYKSFKTMCSTYNVDDIKTDLNVQKICGCYMNDTIIKNFETTLQSGLGASAQAILQSYDIGCFFTPFCGQTNLLSYKKTCPKNICIENVNIDNEGKIEGNVNVKQECIIQPSETTDKTKTKTDTTDKTKTDTTDKTKTDTTDDKEKGKSFFAKYKIPIIAGISGLLLLFIIIIVIVIISKSKKK
jgi:hypothetical protein